MYNNEVTYAEQHNTEENRQALKELEEKYFDKSECSPDCPLAWAPEVLEMMNKLQKELGFLHNEGTMRGYYVQGTVVDWFFKNPWNALFSSLGRNILNIPSEYEKKNGFSYKAKLSQRIKAPFNAFLHPIKYGFRAFRVVKINPILNRIQKNKIRLGQLKEKFGELRCYFHAPEAYSEYLDQEIRKCELKLAAKGVYYPLEGFWDAGVSYSVGTKYRPDTIVSTLDPKDGTYNIKETKYRKAMQDLGMDLDAIKAAAEAAQAKREAEKAANGTV